jgi:hypothetical protein
VRERRKLRATPGPGGASRRKVRCLVGGFRGGPDWTVTDGTGTTAGSYGTSGDGEGRAALRRVARIWSIGERMRRMGSMGGSTGFLLRWRYAERAAAIPGGTRTNGTKDRREWRR